jgi:hypothetical protein
MKLLPIFLLFPVLLLAQPTDFKGSPLSVEERSLGFDEQGNRQPTADYLFVYHFDEAGRVSDQWYLKPGKEKYLFHYVHTYEGDRFVKTVQYSDKDDVWETLEHSYDANGELIRIKRTGAIAAFDQASEVRTDSLGRIIWMRTFRGKDKMPSEITEIMHSGDTLTVSYVRDTTGQLKSTITRRLNAHGDTDYFSHSDGSGAIVYEASYSEYQYDVRGNWTERKSRIQYLFSGEKKVSNTHELRRIVYPAAYPETLTPEYLHGVWTSFVHKLQLEIYPDGTFLVYIDGSRKDGGQWQLDTEKNVISFTGKEHRDEYDRIDYRYEDGAIIFYQPGREEEVRLWKVR